MIYAVPLSGNQGHNDWEKKSRFYPHFYNRDCDDLLENCHLYKLNIPQ